MELDFDKRRKTQKYKLRLIIAGSRNFNDYGRLETECKDFIRTFAPIQPTDICIISGTANGADKLGERFANEFGFHVERFPANWDLYGKPAGHIRNRQMSFVSNAAIIFWDGKSRGTANMVGLCKEDNINLKLIIY